MKEDTVQYGNLSYGPYPISWSSSSTKMNNVKVKVERTIATEPYENIKISMEIEETNMTVENNIHYAYALLKKLLKKSEKTYNEIKEEIDNG